MAMLLRIPSRLRLQYQRNATSISSKTPSSHELLVSIRIRSITLSHARVGKCANIYQISGVSWISTLPLQSQENIDFNDEFYRNRLRALQAVDELVEGVIDRLTKADILDNTYIFHTSDNGYHIGQHRLQPGKECGFEEDINVPLIVRGPGVAKGEVSEIVTSHTDLAPTFLELAGEELRADFDGAAIPITSAKLLAAQDLRSEHVGIEYWGFGLSEGDYGSGFYWNNTYKGLRLIGDDYNFYYSVWCSGEHELYDLTVSTLYNFSSQPQYLQTSRTTPMSWKTSTYTTTPSPSASLPPPPEASRHQFPLTSATSSHASTL